MRALLGTSIALACVALGGEPSIGYAAPLRTSTRPAVVCHKGANCITVGPYAVEVELRPYGKVKAWVRDRQTHRRVHQNLHLQARVPAQDGRTYRVDLNWDQTKLIFSNFLPRGLRPSSGRLQIFLDQRTPTPRRLSGQALAAPTPHPAHGGVILNAGPNTFELVAHENGAVRVYPRGASTRLSWNKIPLRVGLSSTSGSVVEQQLNYRPTLGAYVGRVRDRLQTGPVYLHIQRKRVQHRADAAHIRPLSASEFGGWRMTAGPFTFEVARHRGKLMAVVRDAAGRGLSSRDVALEANFHPYPEGTWPDPMVTLPFRWNPQRMRFELDIPEDAKESCWLGVKVHRMRQGRHEKRPEHALKILGSVKWRRDCKHATK